MEAANTEKLRRVYGRGYFDGMRKAEEQMNLARYAAMERNITGITKKVLDSTPVAEAWTQNQVADEMRRVGIRVDIRAIGSSLNSLVESGLVKESPRGKFCRITCKEKASPALTVVKAKKEPDSEPQAETKPVEKEEQRDHKDTMDKLAELAEKLRSSAAEMSKMASDIDSVAIEVEERIQRVNDNAGKLKQLQALLKDLGA